MSLTTNSSNFHKWGAASPEILIVGLIRVYSLNSWFKFSVRGHPSRTGSLPDSVAKKRAARGRGAAGISSIVSKMMRLSNGNLQARACEGFLDKINKINKIELSLSAQGGEEFGPEQMLSNLFLKFCKFC